MRQQKTVRIRVALAALLALCAASRAYASTPAATIEQPRGGEVCVQGRPQQVKIKTRHRESFIDLSGTTVLLDTNSDVGSFCSLSVINARAGISYYDNTNNLLKFVRE